MIYKKDFDLQYFVIYSFKKNLNQIVFYFHVTTQI